METLITTSKSMPVTGSVLTDKKKATELLDQLRLAVPQEVRASQEVLDRKDHIINQAMAGARQLKSQANEEYRERLDQSELVREAQKRAEEMVSEAEQRATRILQQAEANSHARCTDADAYALRSLRSLERELNVMSGSVRKGIDLLAGDITYVGNGSHRSSD